MSASLNDQKNALRKQIRAGLQKIPPAIRGEMSVKLCALLKKQSFWKNAASILFFAPMTDEVNVWPLLEESLQTGKIIVLPRFDLASQTYVACRVQNLQSELANGQFNIREAAASCVKVSAADLNLVLVPGVALDGRGNRLGRGKGFYDRLLAAAGGIKVGVIFDEQLVEKIPAGKFDVPMDFILTPTRCVKTEG